MGRWEYRAKDKKTIKNNLKSEGKMSLNLQRRCTRLF